MPVDCRHSASAMLISSKYAILVRMKNFRKDYLIRFSDTDPAGILFFPRAFELYHMIFEDWAEAKLGWNSCFSNETYAFPIVNSKVDFKLPLRAGKTATLCLDLQKQGKTSFSLNCKASTDEGLHFVIETSHVCISKLSGRPVDSPSFLMKAFDLK